MRWCAETWTRFARGPLVRRRPRRRWWRELPERRERANRGAPVPAATSSTSDFDLAHVRDDVGVEVDHLSPGCDQRDDDDERNEGQDERVLNHALSRLPARGAYHSGC